MQAPAIEYPILIIDTASRSTRVGVKSSEEALIWRTSEEEASKSLFALLRTILVDAKLTLFDLKSIVYCQGPGSMLAIRTTCMAIRTWGGIGAEAAKNIFTYDCLAAGELQITNAKSENRFSLLIDARRNSWWRRVGGSSPSKVVELVPNSELSNLKEPLYTLQSFPSWTKPDATLIEVPYSIESLFTNTRFQTMIRRVDPASPLALRQSEYAKWSPRIHSATSR